MRIAIAHDYLTQRGGAEKVVLALTRAFPDAPVYTTLYDPEATYPEFRDVDVRASPINRFGIFRRHHRAALPILPVVSSRIHVDADVTIMSSSGWAHGFRTTGLKLVYCYSPARWLYEPERYLGDESARSVRLALRALSPALRRWDQRAAASADRYLAISTVTQERIRRIYGLSAAVVPAPHSVDVAERGSVRRAPGSPPDGYFLVVSRLLPYKNVREIVQAFALRPDLQLLVVGAGPLKATLVQVATPNVTFLENLDSAEMDGAYDGCTAVVAASFEDFGLTPLEAAAHGKPSCVLRWGGFLDTVLEGITGVFFESPDPLEIATAVDGIMRRAWNPDALKSRARQFDEAAFTGTLRGEVAHLAARVSAR